MSRFTSIIPLALAVLLATSMADAAFTSGRCLAQKRKAWGNLRKCEATEQAKALQGNTSDLAKCQTKFQDKLAKISEKASDATIQCRYLDNGDATVTDYDTGLQWEKKNGLGGGANLANAQDVDNTYILSSLGGGCPFTGCPDGTAFKDFLGRLNNCTTGGLVNLAGFAFHCDWRLPTIGELQSILDCGFGIPCIDPTFGPTAAGRYWSSTTETGMPENGWLVTFDTGLAGATNKDSGGDTFVRAVRRGL